jgi:hypothetical protein
VPDEETKAARQTKALNTDKEQLDKEKTSRTKRPAEEATGQKAERNS